MDVNIGNLYVHVRKPKKITQPVNLLFIHGLWGTHEAWLKYLDFFEEQGYLCAALDLRGHGRSSLDGDLGAARVLDYVEDAKTVLATMGDTVVFGHSMGGLITQRLAQDCDIRAAVLCTPAPPRWIPLVGGLDLTRTMLGYVGPILKSQAFLPPIEMLSRFVYIKLSPEEQEEAYKLQVPDSGRAMRDILTGAVAVNQLRVTCPLLVLAGRDDPLVPHPVVQRVARKYGADYRCYAGQSHWLLQEPGWRKVAREIHEWMQGVLAERTEILKGVIQETPPPEKKVTLLDYAADQPKPAGGKKSK
jgi:non-heme chloroperoxidase